MTTGMFHGWYYDLLYKAVNRWENEVITELARLQGHPTVSESLTAESTPVKQRERLRNYTEYLAARKHEAEDDTPAVAPMDFDAEDLALYKAVLLRYRNAIIAECREARESGISRSSLADAEEQVVSFRQACSFPKMRQDAASGGGCGDRLELGEGVLVVPG